MPLTRAEIKQRAAMFEAAGIKAVGEMSADDALAVLSLVAKSVSSTVAKMTAMTGGVRAKLIIANTGDIIEFLDSHVTYDSKLYVYTADLYEAYVAYRERAGLEAVSMIGFSRSVAAVLPRNGAERSRLLKGSRYGNRGFTGMGLVKALATDTVSFIAKEAE